MAFGLNGRVAQRTHTSKQVPLPGRHLANCVATVFFFFGGGLLVCLLGRVRQDGEESSALNSSPGHGSSADESCGPCLRCCRSGRHFLLCAAHGCRLRRCRCFEHISGPCLPGSRRRRVQHLPVSFRFGVSVYAGHWYELACLISSRWRGGLQICPWSLCAKKKNGRVNSSCNKRKSLGTKRICSLFSPLVAALGDDFAGEFLRKSVQESFGPLCRLKTPFVPSTRVQSTGVVAMLFEPRDKGGELIHGVASMDIIEQCLTPQYMLQTIRDCQKRCSVCVIEGNVPANSIVAVAQFAQVRGPFF